MKFQDKLSPKSQELITAYIFVVPAIALLVLFLIVPALTSVGYSFTNYNIMRPDRIKINGVDNYIRLFQDPEFIGSIGNTIYFTVAVVIFQCALALALALLIRHNLRGVGIFRAAYFSPMVTSMVVIAILWTILYNPNPPQGMINALLVKLGMEPESFLRDPETAMNSIIFMSGWQAAGYQMMIFLAGLQAIPAEQYEAASIDGCGKFQQFLHVTLPGLRNVTKYVIMITTIQAMKLFTQPYIMTQGGPQNKTRTLVYYIYQQGIQNRDFGYACSAAVILFIIVVALSFALKKVIRAD